MSLPSNRWTDVCGRLDLPRAEMKKSRVSEIYYLLSELLCYRPGCDPVTVTVDEWKMVVTVYSDEPLIYDKILDIIPFIDIIKYVRINKGIVL